MYDETQEDWALIQLQHATNYNLSLMKCLSGNAFKVYCHAKRWAYDHLGHVILETGELTRVLSLNERTVRRCLRELAKQGVMIKVE